MHARVVTYRFMPGSADGVIRKAEAGLLPIFREQPGFVSYYVIRTGNDTALSISLWDSAENAHAAVTAAQAWVLQHIAKDVASVDAHVYPIAFSGK